VFVANMLESLKSKARNALLNSNAGSAMHYFSRDVFCIKETSMSELNDTMYEPALCVVLQGEKQTNIASRALLERMFVLPRCALLERGQKREKKNVLVFMAVIRIGTSVSTVTEKMQIGGQARVARRFQKLDSRN
jgi:hypothetical protein